MNKQEKVKALKRLNKELRIHIKQTNLSKHIEKLDPILEIPAFSHAIYCFEASKHPEIMENFALVRQICWRAYGCANNEEKDIDHYDISPLSAYQQVIIWDTQKKAILGGLRYVSLPQLKQRLNGVLGDMPPIRTCEMFEISPEFSKTYIPYLLEVQRLFVVPQKDYEETDIASNHANHVVDSLFKGLGTVITKDNIRYITGRVLFPPILTSREENIMIMDFLNEYFAAYELMVPRIKFRNGISDYLSPMYKSTSPHHRRLVEEIPRETLHGLPTLLKIYLNLVNQFYFLGAVAEPEMALALEVAIMLKIEDFKPRIMKRYFPDYSQSNSSKSSSTLQKS